MYVYTGEKIRMTKKEQVQQSQFTIPEHVQKALVALSSDETADKGEPTKFTLLENFHNPEVSAFYADLKNKDEVLQMNDIEAHAMLMPLVFGDTPVVRACASLFMLHAQHHRINSVAQGRKREKALVDSVRGDAGNVTNDSMWKKMIGGGH